MKDQRLQVFRTALDQLIESLDAHVRLSRWAESEPVPEPLATARTMLVTRLGVADRLASSRFVGAPSDVAKVTAMRGAMKRLDLAYVAFCKHGAAPGDDAEAASQLEAEIAATSDLSHEWS